MHIRDGILSNEVCLATGVCAASAIGYSMWRLRQEKTLRPLSEAGIVASLIFAGQMVNVSIPGLPVSGHLIGGAFAAAWLGPWAGCLVMTAVLAVQATVFADGGLLSLGANILNMAVIGAWGGASLREALARAGIGPMTSSAIAAWVTVILAAIAFCVEFVGSWRLRGEEIGSLFGLMVGYHFLIGIGEAALTVSGLVLLGAMAPPVQSPDCAVHRGWRGFVASGLIAACFIAGVCSPWASPYPDGLEAVGERLAFNDRAVDRALALDDYAIPLPEEWEAFALPLAGLLGTLLCFPVAMAVIASRSLWSICRPTQRT